MGISGCAGGSDEQPLLPSMKRFAWLLLAVFCTALAHVQPVEPLRAKRPSCSCCGCGGRCGMPECAASAASGQPFLAGENLMVASRPAAARKVRSDRQTVVFYFKGTIASDQTFPSLAFRSSKRSASVPLFKEHCSFLI
jgi:hypothetical protein